MRRAAVPWTMSDFSLMDAIECGIVNSLGFRFRTTFRATRADVRNLWSHIRTKMPKKGRGQGGVLDPLSLPPQLQSALEALYGHYKMTFELWQSQIHVPPCFIVVCNNTSASKLVYDFVSGFSERMRTGRRHWRTAG